MHTQIKEPVMLPPELKTMRLKPTKDLPEEYRSGMVEGNDGRWRDQSLRGIRPGPMIRPNAVFEKKVQEDKQRELYDEEMQQLGLSVTVGSIPQTLPRPSEKIGKLMRVENRFVRPDEVKMVENSFFQCCANDHDA